MELTVAIAHESHTHFAEEICELIAQAAKQRGTGRGKRTIEEITDKIINGQAIIALYGNKLAGFSYIQPWENQKFVVNTGLIVSPLFRGAKLAIQIKKKAIEVAAEKYPGAKMFSLTTTLPVMKLNTDLGYKPVTYNQLPQDKKFWDGCQSCINYDNLVEKNYKMCFCTAMLLDNMEAAIAMGSAVPDNIISTQKANA